ncbi:MAG: flavin reductase family protein [Candidatus Faecousia sp.]|nr:flavin reductase family protein [Candidatus Faecousia sp.]
MSIKVKGFLKDVGGASRVTEARRKSIETASSVPDPNDFIRTVADALHPDPMLLRVTEIREASPTSRIYRMVPVSAKLPVFQAGQYLSFRLHIGESELTRPYTISSAPCDAMGDNGFVEVTIRRNRPYLVPDYFFEQVKVGTELLTDLPYGTFYYEPLRDSRNLVALAGGSGITPFYSMAREIAFGKMKDVSLTILYGSVHHSDIVLGDELAKLERECPRIKVVHVLSGDDEWKGERGFITKDLIAKYMGKDPTLMFCGPLAMFNLVRQAASELGFTARRFRHDVVGQPTDPSVLPGYPAGNKDKVWRLTVRRGIHEDVISARGDEPVAVALERAAIPVDTHCRCGECGYCRTQLLSGEIFVSPLGDGRREMDKQLGWFHACSAYPVSDLTIKIPIL